MQKIAHCARKNSNRSRNIMRSDECNLHSRDNNVNDTCKNVTIAYVQFDTQVVTLVCSGSIALNLREGTNASFDCDH